LKKLLYIARYTVLAVLLPMLLALAPAMAQNVVYQGETTPLSVDQYPGDTYTWELFRDSTVNFATATPDCLPADADFVGGNTGATVNVEWKQPGIYFFRVTAKDITGCTTNIGVGSVKVIPSIPTAVLTISPSEVCIGEWAELLVTFTGTEPWNFKLEMKDVNGSTVKTYSGIMAANNPYKIPLNPVVTTLYTVIEVTDTHGKQIIPSNTVTLTVNPLPRSSRIYLKKP